MMIRMQELLLLKTIRQLLLLILFIVIIAITLQIFRARLLMIRMILGGSFIIKLMVEPILFVLYGKHGILQIIFILALLKSGMILPLTVRHPL